MKQLYYILFLLVLTACEKRVDWQLQKGDNDLLVVESILTNENKIQTVKLTKAVNEINAAPLPVSGADVTINDGNSTYVLSEDPQKPGVYTTAAPLICVVGKTYELMISYNGENYSATTYMVPVSRFQPLKYIQRPDGKYVITQISPPYSRKEEAMYTVYLDWSRVPGYETIDKGKTRALIYSYSFNSLSTNQIFAPEKETIAFPAGTVIIQKKYSLTPEFADYLKAVVSETEWKGGLFDMMSANTPTNLSNNALGFFGASSVVSDTIRVR